MNQIHKLVQQLEEALAKGDLITAAGKATSIKWRAERLARELFERLEK